MLGANEIGMRRVGLPIHPRRIVGESLESWVNRFAFSNQFSRWQLIGTANDADLPSSYSYSCMVRQISSALAASPNEIKSACLATYSILGTQRDDISSWSTGRTGSRWYCSECLKEDQIPHFRLMWRLVFAPVCVKHHTLLCGSCPNCGTPVELRRRNRSFDVAKCYRCFSSLATVRSNALRVSKQEVEMVSDELGLLDGSLNPSEIGWRQSRSDYFKTLEIAVRVLLRVRNINQGKTFQTSPLIGAELHEPRVALRFLLEAWPLLKDFERMKKFKERHKAVYMNKVGMNGYPQYLEPLHPERGRIHHLDLRLIEGAIRKLGQSNTPLTMKAISLDTGYILGSINSVILREPQLRSLYNETKAKTLEGAAEEKMDTVIPL